MLKYHIMKTSGILFSKNQYRVGEFVKLIKTKRPQNQKKLTYPDLSTTKFLTGRIQHGNVSLVTLHRVIDQRVHQY